MIKESSIRVTRRELLELGEISNQHLIFVTLSLECCIALCMVSSDWFIGSGINSRFVVLNDSLTVKSNFFQDVIVHILDSMTREYYFPILSLPCIISGS